MTKQTTRTRTLTAAEVADRLGVDAESVTKSKGVYTFRVGFYYTHGRTADDLTDKVRAAFPEAVVEDSGEVWKAFRGGASLAQSSHWFVKFTL
jgi:hypothetical protein